MTISLTNETKAGNFVLSADDLHKMNRTSIRVDGGYLGTIGMFHQLHCLVCYIIVNDRLRFELMRVRITSGNMFTRTVSLFHKKHIHHVYGYGLLIYGSRL